MKIAKSILLFRTFLADEDEKIENFANLLLINNILETFLWEKGAQYG